jgi:hypothetical protein
MRTKSALIGAVLLTLLGPWEAGAHRHVPRDVVGSFVEAWNAYDVSRMAQLFEADADLYYPFASFVTGRESIARLLDREQKERMMGSRLRLEGELRVRESWHWASVDYRATLQPKDAAPIPLVLSAVVVQTKVGATRDGDEWSFTSLRMIPGPATEPAR